MEGNYSVKNFESIFEYNTRIGDFDGPLDLLLYLVKQAEIEIKDIFISEVTEQFMTYLEQLDELDIEKAGEYLGVAATLLYEKSKALLPKIEDLLPPEEDEGPSIVQRLEELKLFKDMDAKLKELENVHSFYKPHEPSAKDFRIVYKDFNYEGLVSALSDLLSRVELEKEIHAKREIPKEVFTVPEKMAYIKDFMLEHNTCSFFELFKINASKSEIITTFQAMLELLKRQFIKIVQESVFGDISITLNEERGEDNGDFGDLSEYN